MAVAPAPGRAAGWAPWAWGAGHSGLACRRGLPTRRPGYRSPPESPESKRIGVQSCVGDGHGGRTDDRYVVDAETKLREALGIALRSPVWHPAARKPEMLRPTRGPGGTGPGCCVGPLRPGGRGPSLRDGDPAGRGDDRPGKGRRGRVRREAGRIESALSSRPTGIPPVPEGSGGPPGEAPGLLREGRRRRAAALPGSPGRPWPGPVGGYRWPAGAADRGALPRHLESSSVSIYI